METEFFNEIRTTEHFLLNSMSTHEKGQLLFCILYLAGAPVRMRDILPVFDIQSSLEIVQAQVLIQTLNEDLEGRSAPYYVDWKGVGNTESSILELKLKSEYINELMSYSYFIKNKKLKPEEVKLLAFLAYRNHLAHNPITVDELIELLVKFGFEKDKAEKMLSDLEANGLVYQKKDRHDNRTKIKLSGDFYDIMGLPKDEIALGSAIKDELMKLLEGVI